MRLAPTLRLTAGMLTVFAALALSAPGIVVAEDAKQKPPAEAADPKAEKAPEKAGFEPPAWVEDDDVVVLNGWGFNYREGDPKIVDDRKPADGAK